MRDNTGGMICMRQNRTVQTTVCSELAKKEGSRRAGKFPGVDARSGRASGVGDCMAHASRRMPRLLLHAAVVVSSSVASLHKNASAGGRGLSAPSCSRVRQLDGDTSPIAALVRGEVYTNELPSGCLPAGADCSRESLDPICASGADEPCTESACGTTLDVRFNSRSYVLTSTDGATKCGGDAFRADSDYACVDYRSGVMRLSGTTLSFTVDLSDANCGCNAAIYLVAMGGNPEPTVCKDRYCDANSVCGVRCIEIDLMEANKVAFVSTVHVADDPNGEGFGVAHYIEKPEKRLHSHGSEGCAYGPRSSCAIDTTKPFVATYGFASSHFEYTVTLSQEGRSASLASPVRYVDAPSKGSVGTADAANAQLMRSLEEGLTLVLSYWAGEHVQDMAWLDAPCTPQEAADWHCHDVWTEHPFWDWTCEKGSAAVAPSCGAAFRIWDLRVEAGTFTTTTLIIAGGGAALATLLFFLAYQRKDQLMMRLQGVELVPACERDTIEAVPRARRAREKARRTCKYENEESARGPPRGGSDDEDEDNGNTPRARPPSRPKLKGKEKGSGKASTKGKAALAVAVGKRADPGRAPAASRNRRYSYD